MAVIPGTDTTPHRILFPSLLTIIQKLLPSVLLIPLILIAALSVPDIAAAVCSHYKGRVTINELHKQGSSERFVEVKILDASINSAVYNNWDINICEHGGSCTGPISLSLANTTDFPHVVIEIGLIPNANLIDLRNGTDVLLRDNSGRTIDYVSVAGETGQQDGTCTPAYDWDMASTNGQTIGRFPDGTGDWDNRGPGGSIDPTDGGANDTLPNGDPVPLLDVTNVTVQKGQNAVFTFTLQSGPTAYPISLDYETLDATAVAGTDYTYTTGTLNIPTGSAAGSTVTASVPTIVGAPAGEVYFWLFLDNQVNVGLMNTFAIGTITDPPPLDHLEIDHDGAALTCEPESITVRACQDAACSTLLASNVDITLTPTGWVGGDSKTVSGGSSTFQLRNTTPGTVTLAISSPSPAPTNPTQCFVSGVPGSCDLEFFDSGFVFTVPTQVACETSGNISVSAVRKDITTQQCVPAFANRAENIDFWSTYVTPNTGTQNVSVNGTAVAGTSPGTSLALNFDASGEALITVSYPDAGQMQLDASFSGSGSEAGLVMTGNSTYVVRPAGLCVYSDDVNADCASGDATCSTFLAADETFNLKVKGVCWQAAGETNTDFCDNPITPNFQLNNIAVSQNLVAPAAGNAGTIGVNAFDIIAADAGEHIINNQQISEVGVFTFTADPPDYLGAGDVIPTSTSANIGRFFPDHFNVTVIPDPPAFANACTPGNFTYLGDTFNFAINPQVVITAENVNGVATQNYEGTFWKLAEPFTINYTYADTGAPVSLTPAAASVSAAAGATANCNGTLALTLTDTFSYTRPIETSPVAPFASSIDLSIAQAQFTDTDTVCFDTGTGCQDFSRAGIIGVNLRHGRLDVFNNFGPETEDITNSLYQIEYWDDFDADTFFEWDRNPNEDSALCTTEASLTFCIDNINHTVNIDAGTLINGAGTLTVTKDPADVSRTVRVCPITAPTTLTSLAGCAAANEMCGDFTFGIYRGNDRIINWQELVR